MKKSANRKKNTFQLKLPHFVDLPGRTGQWSWGVGMIVLAAVMTLGFFGMAGMAGGWVVEIFKLATGGVVYALPVVLLLAGIICFMVKQDNFSGPLVLAVLLFWLGLAAFVADLDITKRGGGELGYWLALPVGGLFGPWVTLVIFGAVMAIAIIIFWWLLGRPMPDFASFDVSLRNPNDDKKLAVPVTVKKSLPFRRALEQPKAVAKPMPQFSKEIKKPVIALGGGEKTARDELKKSSGTRGTLMSKIQYKNPPIDLLDKRDTAPLAGDVKQNAAIIKRTLENFGIPVEMSPEIIVGPSVTQYALKPAEGVKLSKITALSNDLSLSLAASSIRIEAPIPGKALVGVEVPNKGRAGVGLRELLSTNKFQQSTANLLLALGKDILGEPIYADISKMPHLLVAGATGTGKTIFLNSVLTSLLYRNPPEMLRMILVDPKRVEMKGYNKLPHLLTPTISDVNKTVAALKWAISEMDRRFDVLGEKDSRNIGSYNEKCAKDGDEPLPYIVFVIDELADLMATKGKEVEAGIVRLAQMARAVGIHLIVATQRPSVEVITGLIKANITCRVAFQVASQIDSRTILDISGAEKLLGAGDLLYMSAEYPKPKRIQGPYISEKESKNVLDWIKENNPMPEFVIEEGVLESFMAGGEPAGREYNGSGSMFSVNESAADGFDDDPMYEQAKKVVIEARKASASFLQRRLRIGYARAARIIDILEERGVVGAGEGAKPRDVLVSAMDIAEPAPGGLSGDVNEIEGQETDDGWQKV